MASPIAAWRRFLARPNGDRVKTLGIAFLVAFCAALLVSTASVLLKPRQQAHIEAARQAQLDRMLDTLPGLRDLMLEAGVDALQTRLVNLETGSFATGIDPATFDPRAAAQDPATSIDLPPEADIAGLKRRATLAPVYLLESDGELKVIVLPVEGAGYQSTIRAYLALEADLNTIAALTIYEQGDTPGLGARITEPAWAALWPGKQIADGTGEVVISVVRGQATTPYEVDGIAGATRTSSGVHNMLRFWLGPYGYGPFLETLKAEGL